MSIAEKLVTVAENVPKVYDAGYANGYADGAATGGDTEAAYNEGLEAGKSDFILAWQNKTLTELVVPDGVTALSEYCFYSTKPLNKITLPEGLTTIGRYSFRGCTVIHWNFPSTLTDIGEHAFATNYTFGYHQELVFPENLKTIGVSAFAYTHIRQEELVFPASVESIGNMAFASALANTNKRIVFKGTPTSIHSAAFNGCTTPDIYCPWPEGAVAGSPWGCTSATIHYNYTEEV